MHFATLLFFCDYKQAYTCTLYVCALCITYCIKSKNKMIVTKESDVIAKLNMI